MNELNSKRIIITGGSLGIGFAVAKACAMKGAEVITAARNQNNLDESLKEIHSISDKNHLAYSLDVGNLQDVNAFAKAAGPKRKAPIAPPAPAVAYPPPINPIIAPDCFI